MLFSLTGALEPQSPVLCQYLYLPSQSARLSVRSENNIQS